MTTTTEIHFKKLDRVRQPSTGRSGTVYVTWRGRSEAGRSPENKGKIFVVDSAGTGGWYEESQWTLLEEEP